MALQLYTAPTIEPLTLSEATAHLRVDSDDDMLLVESLITAARIYCENKTNRQFINATYKLSLDQFPVWNDCRPRRGESFAELGGVIRVPRPRLQSVTSITYVDLNGDTQTLSTSNYTVDTQSEPGRIVPAYNSFWPGTRTQVNAVVVTYVAGFGANATSVPESIKAAMKLIIGHLYENREAVNIGNVVNEVPMAVDSLLGTYALPEVL